MKSGTGTKASRAVGRHYEELAAKYLEKAGYHILERNFQCRQGEIDIIAQNEGYLCFVEVKYRKSETYGGALGAVSYKKQEKISRAALYYLTVRGYGEAYPCRFDVLAITREQMTLIKNAFEYRG